MAKIGLAVYTVRVHHRGNPAEALNLSKLVDRVDFLDVLKKYLSKLKDEISKNETLSNLMYVKNYTEDGRMIYGQVASGDYGISAELLNLDTQKIIYRSPSDAEIMPFYFLFYIPENSDMGFLLCQRIKTFGIRTILMHVLLKYFRPEYADFVLTINPYVQKDIAKEFLKKGRVSKISYTSFKLPDDIADGFFGKTNKKMSEDVYIEYVIHSKKNKFIDMGHKLFAFLQGKEEIGKAFEIKAKSLPGFNQIKVKVDVDGSPHMIPLNDMNKIRSYYDISEQVPLKRDGTFEYSKIDKMAKSILSEILNDDQEVLDE